MGQEVHIFVRQVGSAYPLAEFTSILRKVGYKTRAFAFESIAGEVFKKYGYPVENMAHPRDYFNLNLSADIIFTGTSEKGSEDALLWEWAQQRNIFSLAWVDQPINLDLRFSVAQSRSCLPDYAVANDAITLNAIRNYELETKSVCFGSPYLAKLQSSLKRHAGTKTGFFITEPTGPDYRQTHGFDDIDAFLLAHTLFHALPEFSGAKFPVKLHPRDSADGFRLRLSRKIASGAPPEYEVTSLDKDKILESATAIFGMRSMLLFEASALGIPTFSFQPGRKSRFPFIDEQPNIRVLVDEHFDLPAISKFVESRLSSNPIDFVEADFIKLVERRSYAQE